MIDPNEMKIAIATTKVPHVLKNIQLDWPIMKMNFEEWCQQMDEHCQGKSIEFTTGSVRHHDLPYWERFREKESMCFGEFIKKAKNNQFGDRWVSHSYIDINSWPDSLRNSINFNKLGFEHTEDVLFWLGSRGANTPCHYDTYGFNIVVQIFGRKSWLLFPPKTPLNATRVPYEESSVYCRQNFYSPADMKQFGDIGNHGNAYEIVLSPGDVLVVPANWWHYVENLETSLAVNTWIPLDLKDATARLEECFVRMQIEKITEASDVDGNLQKYIFNPNESSSSDLNLLNLFKPLADIIMDNLKNDNKLEWKANCTRGQTIRIQFQNIFHKAEPIGIDRFKEILRLNSSRFDASLNELKTSGQCYQDIENVINAVCHPKTVKNACELYLQQIQLTDHETNDVAKTDKNT